MRAFASFLASFLLIAVSYAPVARAAITFQGHAPTATSCQVFLDWSSDYGADWIASRPISVLSSGIDIEADTARTLSYGSVSGAVRAIVAPAGPVSFATGPALSIRTSGSAVSNGTAGHSAETSHSACLQFVPPGAGSTVHWAVRWRRVVTGAINASRSTDLRGPNGQFFSGPGTAGADSGMVFGTAPGTTSQLCAFTLNQMWAMLAGNNGVSSGSVDVDVYLDNAPPPLEVGDTAPRPLALELASPRPSPARGASTFEYALPEAGDVTIEILDVSGRRVARHDVGSRPAGRHVMQWEAVDASGERLDPGVYFVRLGLRAAAGPARFASRRVVVTS